MEQVVGLGVGSGLQCSILTCELRIERVYWVCVRVKPSRFLCSSIPRKREAGPRSLSQK